MARKKERIDTSGGRSLAADNPFAALSPDGLKAGPPQPPQKPEPPERPKRGTLRLRRLTAHRGGKVVTEIAGLPTNSREGPELLKRLQKKLGTGGKYASGVIELQGEWRAPLKPLLEADGWRVRG